LLHLNEGRTLTLETIPPYSFELTVHKPAGWWWSTPYEVYENGRLWTVTRFNGFIVGLRLESEVTNKKRVVNVTTFASKELSELENEEIKATIERALRTKEDLQEFYALASKDKILKETANSLCGMHTVSWPELFPALILAVTLQMAPMKRSNEMMDLLICNFGEEVSFDGKNVYYWPSTKEIASTSIEILQSKGKLGYRAKNLVSIAASLEVGFPTMDELYKMERLEAKKRLLSLRGIGDYSAELVMPGMGFPLDVWSAKIFGVLFKGEVPEDPRQDIPELKRIAEDRWGKWAGYAFVYLLNDLRGLSGRVGLDLTKF
jgi:DNA-3-methyladenine glycosylase II